MKMHFKFNYFKKFIWREITIKMYFKFNYLKIQLKRNYNENAF